MCTERIGVQPMLERLGIPAVSQKVAMKQSPMDNLNQAPHKARLSIVLWNTCRVMSGRMDERGVLHRTELQFGPDHKRIGTRYATFTLSDMICQGILYL